MVLFLGPTTLESHSFSAGYLWQDEGPKPQVSLKVLKPNALRHPGSDICMCLHGLPSVWTQKSTCHLIETSIREQEELEGKKVPQYPCLWVNVSAVGRWAVLYHTEDTRDQNQQVLTGGGGMGRYPLAPGRCVGFFLTESPSLLWGVEAERAEPT